MVISETIIDESITEGVCVKERRIWEYTEGFIFYNAKFNYCVFTISHYCQIWHTNATKINAHASTFRSKAVRVQCFISFTFRQTSGTGKAPYQQYDPVCSVAML